MTPKSLGINDDVRALGLGFISMRLLPQASPDDYEYIDELLDGIFD